MSRITNLCRHVSRIAASITHSPQVIRSHEPLVADRADEVLLAGVRPRVPGQLVGAGEALAAAGPRTGKGTLACN